MPDRRGAVPPIEGAKSANPFSAAAQAEAGGAMLSTPEARAQVAPQLAALREDGWVVLPNAIATDEARAIAAEIGRINETTDWGRSPFDGYRTRRAYNLLAKTRALDALCLHPQVLALVESYLQDELQLSQALGITIYPGQEAQALHRDDGYYPLPRPRLPLVVNAFWALTDFTEENGATHFLPGTHRTAEPDPPAREPLRAVMPAGSVVVYDGALFHGGGANRSDAPRIGLTLLYARAWLRQQENQYLAVPREVVRGLSRPLQRLLGYWVAGNLLGWVEGRSPLHGLHATPDGDA